MTAQDVIAPRLDGRAVQSLKLEMQNDQAIWIISFADGDVRRADGKTGALLPPVSAPEARILAETAFAGDAKLASIQRTSAEEPPLDLRRARPTWQAQFEDGTRVYIDADSEATLALRTRFWRVFDFMWGLHIMDLQTREDNHHPTLIGFASLAVISVIFGLILMFRRRKKPL